MCEGSWPIIGLGKLQPDRAVGAAAEVDRDLDQRFIEWDGAVGKAGDPRALAERLVDRAPERDRDVLHRVVRVDVEIAAGLDGQVEPAVSGELVEHVVEHPNAGLDLRGARAVELQRKLDICLFGDAFNT